MVRMIVTSADLPPVVDGVARAAGERDPDNRLLRPAGPLPARRRDWSATMPWRSRGLLVAEDRRAERQAVSAGRLLGVPELPAARVRGRHGREPVSPRPLHVLAADVPAPQPAGLRRPEPRGMHGRAPALEHAAAGAGPAERPDLRRGGPRLRRADPARAGARPSTRGSRWAYRQRAAARARPPRRRRVLADLLAHGQSPSSGADPAGRAASSLAAGESAASPRATSTRAELAAWTSVARSDPEPARDDHALAEPTELAGDPVANEPRGAPRPRNLTRRAFTRRDQRRAVFGSLARRAFLGRDAWVRLTSGAL